MHSSHSLEIRPATLTDHDQILALINISSRSIGIVDYTPEQIEIALRAVLDVDTQLIKDVTYFVAVNDDTIVGCGGWSFRATLFGGDNADGRDNAKLDPAVDAAKIRAFYVHPDFARKGIATGILNHCENEARKKGFQTMELGATLPGEKFFGFNGYIGGTAFEYELETGQFMTIVPMKKDISAAEQPS